MPNYDEQRSDDKMKKLSSDDKKYRGNESVLVVDDEPALLFLVNEVLSENGYKVFDTDNTNEALKILKKEKIDLLITDIIMPEMDGYQFSALVQEKYPEVKIQLMSGYSDHHNAEMVDETLHQNLMHKPYQAKTLLIRIRELLDS